MTKIVLISCVSKKLDHRSKAEDIYVSPLFKKNLKYAKSLNPDEIFILSAKYGLLSLEEEIDPYEKTLNNMHIPEIREWADLVLDQLNKVSDLNGDEFVFLAGDKYRKFLIPHIKNYEVPMLSLTIGKQLQWLTEHTPDE